MTMLDRDRAGQDRAVAGWYPDPWRRAPLRWWDGTGWTDATGGAPVPPQEVRARQRRLSGEHDRLQRERAQLVNRLYAIDHGIADVQEQLRQLETVAASAGAPLAAPPPSAAPPARAPSGAPPVAPGGPRRRTEWRGATLGNVLLGLGTLLLTIAALVFATVSWPSLDDTQRALVLLGVTVICGAGAAVLHDRLHNTAQAFSVLFVGFLLVDWLAARRAGMGAGVGGWWSWAAGFALAAGAAVVLAALLRMVVQQVVAVALAFVSVGCIAMALAVDGGHPWFTATIGLAAIAVLGVLAEVGIGRRPRWRAGAVTALIGAYGAAVSTAGAAIVTLAVEGTGLWAAGALVAIAAAPTASRLVWPATTRHPVAADALVGTAMMAAVAGTTAGLAAWFPGWPTVTVLAAVALAVLVLAARGPRPLARGSAVAGLVALGLAVAAAAIPTLVVATGSFSVFGRAWDGTATTSAASVLLRANTLPADAALMFQGLWLAGVWACVTTASLLPMVASSAVRRKVPPAAQFSMTGSAAAILLLTVVVGVSGSVLAVVLVMLGATTLLVLVAARVAGPPRPLPITATAPMLLALACGTTALTWSIYERWCTVLALTVLTAIAAAGAVLAGRTGVRSTLATVTVLLALLLAVVVPAALEVPVAITGLCLIGAAGLVLLGSAWLAARLGITPVAPVVVSVTGLTVGLLFGGAGWSSGPQRAVVLAVALAGVAVALVAPRTTDVLLRGSAVAVGSSLLIAAAGLAASAAGASVSVTGVAVAATAAVALPLSTTVLRAHDAGVARAQRLVLASVGVIGAAAGTVLAGLGTGDPVTQGWSNDPWLVVASLGMLLAAASVAAWPGQDEDLHLALLSVASGAFVLEAALVPAAAGAVAAWSATAATIAAGALLAGAPYVLGRRPHDALAVQAVTFAALQVAIVTSFAGWEGDARWAPVVAVAVGSLACLAASPRLASRPARLVLLTEGAAAAAAAAALAARAAGADGASTGLVLVGAGSVGVLVATWGTTRRAGEAAADARLVLEVIGFTVMVVGAVVATADPSRFAEALTLAFPVVTAVGLRSDRSPFQTVAAVVALGAVWAWLWVGGVRAVEAYTLPAAAAALIVSLLVLRGRPGPSSWVAFAPALMVALFPSLALCLREEGAVRPLALLVAGTAVVLVGVWRRLQAPVILGGFVVIVVAVDTLWPVAAQVPRWVVLAAAGACLVWLGATIERRVRQARDLGGFIGHLH